VNLNHGFYKVGNWIWFGIYMHANHHKIAKLFNPAKMEEVLARRAARAEERKERRRRQKEIKLILKNTIKLLACYKNYSFFRLFI